MSRCLKEKFFNGWVAKTPDLLDERLCQALRWFIDRPAAVASITSIDSIVK